MKFSLLRFTNSVLLGAMLMLAISGVYGLYWVMPGWMFDVHRASGWVLMVTIPWKTAISWRSLRRGLKANFDRGTMVLISLLISVATLLLAVLGYAWQWRLGPASYLQRSLISWHWILGLGLILPFLAHAFWRWPRPRRTDLVSRRAALKLIGIGAASLSAWWLADLLATRRESEGSPRHITGSRLDGYFSGNRFPVTHTIPANREQTELSTWRLVLTGELSQPQLFTYEDVLALPTREKTATLDCTLGWYTIQAWSGVALKDLLAEFGADPGSGWVNLQSVTGYGYSLPMVEARDVLLATHVGGEPLSHAHGAPLRAVVPSRRGWFWVKWMAKVEVG